MSNCGAATETIIHYPSRCQLYSVQRVEHLDRVFFLIMLDCTGLTVTDYILLEFCVLFRPQF